MVTSIGDLGVGMYTDLRFHVAHRQGALMEDTTPRISWTNVLVHLIWCGTAVLLFLLHILSQEVVVTVEPQSPAQTEGWSQDHKTSETPNLGSPLSEETVI